MEPDPLNNNTTSARKVRFAPKAPRRAPKPEVKPEVVDDADTLQARDLMRRFNEGSMKARPKVERKVAPSQVAFGYGGAATSIKSYGSSKGGSNSNGYQRPTSSGSAHASGLKEKEYKEPWDYYSYYPVTLPVRRPYSGNPELLDEEEFRVSLESTTYDENSIKPVTELGLLDENPDANMFFLQLPPTMPMIKRSATADGHKVTNSSMPPGGACSVEKAGGLAELPAGFMGKMLVYKSGAVKLKLGDTLYDVSPGLDCVFAQDVVAINTKEKHCCTVGELSKRATVTPDVDSIFDSMTDLL